MERRDDLGVSVKRFCAAFDAMMANGALPRIAIPPPGTAGGRDLVFCSYVSNAGANAVLLSWYQDACGQRQDGSSDAKGAMDGDIAACRRVLRELDEAMAFPAEERLLSKAVLEMERLTGPDRGRAKTAGLCFLTMSGFSGSDGGRESSRQDVVGFSESRLEEALSTSFSGFLGEAMSLEQREAVLMDVLSGKVERASGKWKASCKVAMSTHSHPGFDPYPVISVDWRGPDCEMDKAAEVLFAALRGVVGDLADFGASEKIAGSGSLGLKITSLSQSMRLAQAARVALDGIELDETVGTIQRTAPRMSV